MRTDSPNSIAPREASSAKKRFTLASVFAGLWLFGLGVLSFLTANPTTLNRDQILSATDVVTAVVEDPKAETIRVEKSWRGAISDEQLVLSNLHGVKPAKGDRLLIPVTKSRDGWRITLSRLPNEPPLVYPVTPESEGQLRQLLKAGR